MVIFTSFYSVVFAMISKTFAMRSNLATSSYHAHAVIVYELTCTCMYFLFRIHCCKTLSIAR